MNIENQISNGEFFGEAVIDCETYSAAKKYVRNSCLTKISRSPAHYLHCQAESIFDTPSLIFGRAMHAVLLEPQLNKVVVSPKLDRRKTEHKTKAQEFETLHQDKIILKEEDYERLQTIQKKVLSSSTAKILLSGGKAEHSFFWRDPTTNVACRARLDLWQPEQNVILDIKTTAHGADRDSFETSIGRYLYFHQAAFYRSAVEAVLERAPDFVFLAIETEPPYEFAFYRLNEAALEKGWEMVQQNLQRLKECMASGEFAGYSHEIQDIGIPSWCW